MSPARPLQLSLPAARPGRPQQLTIARCPHCTRFISYSGRGRPPVTCGAADCRAARRRARLLAQRLRARPSRILRTLLIAALYRRSRRSSS